MQNQNTMAGVEVENSHEQEEIDDSSQSAQDTDKSDKLIKLPLARIRTIIKQDPDVNLASHDAVVLIAKATELFVNELATECYIYTANSGRKTIQKKDVENAMERSSAMAFLEGAVD